MHLLSKLLNLATSNNRASFHRQRSLRLKKEGNGDCTCGYSVLSGLNVTSLSETGGASVLVGSSVLNSI